MFKPTQVKMDDCEFYENEEKRTVVCVFKGAEDMAREFFENYFPQECDYFICATGYWVDKMNGEFRGIAHCNEGDEWQPKIGRKVAFLKMRKKLSLAWFNAVNKRFDRLFKQLNFLADRADNICEKMTNELQSMETQINKEINGES